MVYLRTNQILGTKSLRNYFLRLEDDSIACSINYLEFFRVGIDGAIFDTSLPYLRPFFLEERIVVSSSMSYGVLYLKISIDVSERAVRFLQFKIFSSIQTITDL